MDQYYGSGTNDLLVPKHQDISDMLPSPDSWSKWEIIACESFNLPKDFLLMDANPIEEEFNFNDGSFDNESELESCLHDKDHSSSLSVCGEFPGQSFQQKVSGCDQPNFQLHDLLGFEPTDDNFLNSIVDPLPNFGNLTSGPQCMMTSGGLQQDIAGSVFVPCNLKPMNPKDELRTKDLSPFERKVRDEAINEQSSLEKFVLLDLEKTIAQLTQKTRICYRDALYRLAQSTQQEHPDLNIQRVTQCADQNETVRSEDKKLLALETNTDDQAIVNIMLNRMEINVEDLALTNVVNARREIIGTKGPQSKFSLVLDHYLTQHANILNEAQALRFGRMNQATAGELHLTCTGLPMNTVV